MYNAMTEMEDETELENEFESQSEFEGELEAELEDEFELEGEFENELESELESEGEFELEFEGPNPINKVYPDAMMEHLGLAAMNAETEDEAAEHFLPLIPMVASKLLPLAAKALPKLAGKVLPRIARAITHVTPNLTRGVTHITRALHRNPQTRPLLRTIPSVARRAIHTIAKRTAAGHRVTPAQALRILHGHRRHVMHNPHVVRSVLHRSKLMDRHLHRAGGVHARPVAHRKNALGTYGGHASHGASRHPHQGRYGVPVRSGAQARHLAWRGPEGSRARSSAPCANCGHRAVRRVCTCYC
jgi:hypothetical protein